MGRGGLGVSLHTLNVKRQKLKIIVKANLFRDNILV